MPPSSSSRPRSSSASSAASQALSPEHYLRLIWHRKWLVLLVFILVSGTTAYVAWRMPNIYTSETVILVDPQKVPENYVKPTVTGDVRNRLGTLSQQILSATRLQKIIETLNLYPDERREMAREDVLSRMRKDISVNVLSEFAGGQDLQAFRVGYSGSDPKLVAQVANELAALFIEENLKAREQQATGTAEFLGNQLEETRKTLEAQENKLRDFKLRHIGEMPEQQQATLQILGQLQAQLQVENDALSRAEQQRSYLQSMLATQSIAPVVDMDNAEPRRKAAATQSRGRSPADVARARLASLRQRYSDEHPEIRKLLRQIEDYEAEAAKQEPEPEPAEQVAEAEPVKRTVPMPGRVSNPVLESQLRAVDAEIAKHKEEKQRLGKLVGGYQSKLEAIPVREQEMTNLVRDYEISKDHYKKLLENQMSAQTATQLEIRQKGERFTILDPAQPAERPSRPNRMLINGVGSVAGLVLGLFLALATEFLGMSITSPDQITAIAGVAVLEVIPVIQTRVEQGIRRRRLIFAAGSSVMMMVMGACAFLLYRYHTQGGL